MRVADDLVWRVQGNGRRPTLASASSELEVADRFANALFDLAEENKTLDQAADDLASWNRAVDSSTDLALFVRNPSFSGQERIQVVEALQTRMRCSDLMRRFFGVITAHNRLSHLKAIESSFRVRLAVHRGEILAQVTTATKLSDHQVCAVQDAVSDRLKKKAVVGASVDPNLLGGMIVQVGSKMIDLSLGTRLRNLERAMRGAR